jgi:hypothetical protein
MIQEVLPKDYEVCGTCGFDHEYEPMAAYNGHCSLGEDKEHSCFGDSVDTSNITVYQFGEDRTAPYLPGGPLHIVAWNSKYNPKGEDYESDRAVELYKALGVKPGGCEWVLGLLPDGRWCLVGCDYVGAKFAVENS